MTARTLSLATSPPKTPESSGAASVSSTSGPKWRSDERGDRLVVVVVRGGGFELGGAVRGLGGVGGAGCGAEEGAAFERGEVGGDHHAHAVGHGDELAVARRIQVTRLGVERRGELGRPEAEVAGELGGPGFFADPAVGAQLDGEAVAVDGADGAAQAVGVAS